MHGSLTNKMNKRLDFEKFTFSVEQIAGNLTNEIDKPLTFRKRVFWVLRYVSRAK